MDELLKSFGSLSWWVTVVIVGLAVNLASAYLKPRSDSYLSSISSWWRNNNIQREAEWQKKVDALINDTHKQILLAIDTLYLRIRAVVSLMVAAVSLWASKHFAYGVLIGWGGIDFLAATEFLITGIGGLLLMYSGVVTLSRAQTQSLLLQAAKKSE
jgi:hypothetical protein